jgi:hypothetical protein
VAEKIKQITEDTLVPLGIVFLLVSVVSWVTTLSGESKAHGSDIAELREVQKDYHRKIDRVIEKGKLGIPER